MFTEVLIPIQPAPKDPKWMIKKHAGKKLDPLEIEEYLKFKHDNENKYLVSGAHSFAGIPSSATIGKIVIAY